MSEYTALCYLGFRGDFDAMEVPDGIPLPPDTRLLRHHLDQEKKIPKESLLHYGSSHTDQEIPDLYELTDGVIEKLSPYSDHLLAIKEKYDCSSTLQVVLYFPVSEEISTPIMGFSSNVLSFVHKIGATIDIDTYRT